MWWTLLLLIATIFAYSLAPNTITSNECYYINRPGTYTCTVALNSQCFYDIIIENTKNVNLNCNFKRILIYNSSNIYIQGGGYVIYWNSNNISCSSREYKNVVYNSIGYLICAPKGLFVYLYVKNVSIGVMSNLTLYIYPYKEYNNVLIKIGNSCPTDFSPKFANIPVLFIGNKVFIKKIAPNNTIKIEYFYRINSGKNCIFIVNVKTNESEERILKFTNVLGYSKPKEYIRTDEIFLIPLILFSLLLLRE